MHHLWRLNLNFKTESSNTIIKELKRNDFTQVIGEPTHMQGGIIDHLYIRQPEAYKVVESLKKPVSTLEESEIESHLSKGLMIGKKAVDYAISSVEYSNQLIMFLLGKHLDINHLPVSLAFIQQVHTI